MRDDSSLRVSALVNVVIVLVVALFQLSSAGSRQIDERPRPWGCRTCAVPPSTGGGNGPLGTPSGAATPNATGRPPTPKVCDGDCPGWVEMLLAACESCSGVVQGAPVVS